MTAEYSQISIMYIQLPEPANEKRYPTAGLFSMGYACINITFE